MTMKTLYQILSIAALIGAIAASFVGNAASAATLIGLAILYKLDAQAAA